ncbi:MAG: hypothetical protein HY716_05350 [Planctomycetes bacterium]|nr:hypothetical protein [Planctomycetota bacterium]
MKVRLGCLPLLFAVGCAVDPLEQSFGPDGRTIRQAIEAFPPEQKEAFGIFQRRCSTCHSLNEAFAAHVPPGSWAMVVRKMSRKSGAGIPREDVEPIAEFLEFFHDQRRR